MEVNRILSYWIQFVLVLLKRARQKSKEKRRNINRSLINLSASTGWDKRQACDMNLHIDYFQCDFLRYIFSACIKDNKWVTIEETVIDFMNCLFIFFRPLLFLLSHTDQHQLFADESKSTMTTVKKNRIRVEHPSHYIYMCVFFVCGYKERKKKRVASLLFRGLCFPSRVPVIYTSFFLIARQLFTLLFLLFLCVRLLFVPLYLLVCLAFFCCLNMRHT